jgi:hypothetical protein
MTVATRTNSALAATITQASLTSAINQALLDSGFTQFSSYTLSGTNFLVYAFSSGTGVVSVTYYRVSVTSGLVVSHQLFSGWNTTTNSGTNGSGEVFSTTFVGSQIISFISLNAFPEYRKVLVIQGSVAMMLGCMNPQQRQTIWALDTWNHNFIWASFTALVSTTLNPFSNVNYTPRDINESNLASPSTAFNASTIDAGLKIFTNSLQGCWTQTSNDIACAPTTGRSRGDTFTANGFTFLVCDIGSGRLLLRVG